MLFLSLENQLFLIITIVFSSFMFINSMIVKSQSAALRAFGISFSLPFFFTIWAFLISPFQKAESEAFLIWGYFLLLFLSTAIVLLNEKSYYFKLFYAVPFLLILISMLMPFHPINSSLMTVFIIVDFLIIIVNLSLVIYSLIHRDSAKFPAYLALSLIALALGMKLNFSELSLRALLPLTVGYVACVIYAYRNSLGAFFKEHQKNTDNLRRYNQSIQTEVIRRVEQIEKSNKKLLEKSKTDSMTGFYIKTALFQIFEAILERSPKSPLSVIIFDIDNFKTINDLHGHQVGDRCIKNLAQLSNVSFKKDDIICRYGGDEFLVLLPDASPVKAYLTAERFIKTVENLSSPNLTISIGISNYPEHGQSVNELIDAADKALYLSKQNGRNRITTYSEFEKRQD